MHHAITHPLQLAVCLDCKADLLQAVSTQLSTQGLPAASLAPPHRLEEHKQGPILPFLQSQRRHPAQQNIPVAPPEVDISSHPCSRPSLLASHLYIGLQQAGGAVERCEGLLQTCFVLPCIVQLLQLLRQPQVRAEAHKGQLVCSGQMHIQFQREATRRMPRRRVIGGALNYFAA